MALVVEDGTGVTDADSYIALADANSYFVGRRLFSAAWSSSSSNDKEVALRQASFLLDNEFTWSGQTPVSATQGLGWPFSDALDRYGNAISGVPRQILDATCEVAFYLMAQERLTDKQGVGLQSLKVDVITLKFDGSASPHVFPPHVVRMLVGIGAKAAGGSSILTVRLYRV